VPRSGRCARGHARTRCDRATWASQAPSGPGPRSSSRARRARGRGLLDSASGNGLFVRALDGTNATLTPAEQNRDGEHIRSTYATPGGFFRPDDEVGVLLRRGSRRPRALQATGRRDPQAHRVVGDLSTGAGLAERARVRRRGRGLQRRGTPGRPGAGHRRTRHHPATGPGPGEPRRTRDARPGGAGRVPDARGGSCAASGSWCARPPRDHNARAVPGRADHRRARWPGSRGLTGPRERGPSGRTRASGGPVAPLGSLRAPARPQRNGRLPTVSLRCRWLPSRPCARLQPDSSGVDHLTEIVAVSDVRRPSRPVRPEASLRRSTGCVPIGSRVPSRRWRPGIATARHADARASSLRMCG